MNELFNTTLEGRTALVCGASAGIGQASARVLASLGAKVVLLARSEEALRATIKELGGTEHVAIACDLNDHAELQARIQEQLRNGPLEILVNNSAGPKGGPILDAAPEEFSRAFHQHLITNQLLSQLLIPGMKARGYGRIINIVSTSVRQPIPGLGVSNTIRAAVHSWAKTLSFEVAAHGITVNSVLPGYTETLRLSSLIQAAASRSGKSQETVAEEWRAATPAKRFGRPEEVAAAVAFLASPAAAFITGVALPVDGGRISAL